MFRNLVAAGYAKIDAAFADKGGDIGSGEEDEGNVVVFDEGNVEAGFTAELNVRASQEVEGGLLEAALCGEAISRCGGKGLRRVGADS